MAESEDKQKKQESEDSLDALKKSLYSRGGVSKRHETSSTLRKHQYDVGGDWQHSGAVDTAKPYIFDPQKRLAFLKKFFVASVIFFFLALGVALFIFFRGTNTISTDNVDIAVSGPVSIAGGEPLSLDITVNNQNNTALQAASLLVEYPAGTKEADNLTTDLRRYRELLGDIPTGQTMTRKVGAVLFGQEGQTEEIDVSVEYRVRGSNAIFYKQKKYNITISSAPVTLTINALKEVNSNQDVEFSIDLTSNSSSVIQNLLLTAEYPFGFEYASASPDPSSSNSSWQLGSLVPGGKTNIKIRGKITGQDGEQRTFRFSVGTQSPTDQSAIGTVFLSGDQTITIKKPFIGLNLVLDGTTDPIYIASAGKTIRADATWSNNLGAQISDAKILVTLQGDILDKLSVSAGDNGFYRSLDNTISWDQTTKRSLAILNPDDSGQASFSFATIRGADIAGAYKDPSITVTIAATGKRLNDAGQAETVGSTLTRTVKIASVLGLSTRILYNSGPFTNTGPIPPKADQSTSYTIVWSVTDSSSDLANVRVSATLPPYVTWLNVSSPQSEHVTYNPLGGQILWDVGSVPAGTGFSSNPREVYFQVSLQPSLTQINSMPAVVGDTTAEGDDTFTDAPAPNAVKIALTTQLNTDINFKPSDAIVGR